MAKPCYFRKPLNLRVAGEGRIEIAADDQYELYVNGTLVARGGSHREMDEFEITDHLEVGRNVIAVKVVNTQGDNSGVSGSVSIRPEQRSNGSRSAAIRRGEPASDEIALWNTVVFNDRLCGAASRLANWAILLHGTATKISPRQRKQNNVSDFKFNEALVSNAC